MAITIEQTVQGVDELIRLVESEMPREAVRQAITLKSVIQSRIQNTGTDSNGNKLPEYSDGYKVVRSKKNLFTSPTDLTFTGDMWGQTGLKGSTKGKKFLVNIGGQTKEAQDKLNWNSVRYGDLLRPNPKERANVVADMDAFLTKLALRAFR